MPVLYIRIEVSGLTWVLRTLLAYSIDNSEARSRVKRHAAGPKSVNSGLDGQWVDDVRSL